MLFIVRLGLKVHINLKGDLIFMKAKKVSYKKQKKMFAKTSGTNTAKSINARPRPQRTGFRI